MASFEEMGLSPAVMKAITEQGFEEPTPVQAKAIPALMSGRDVLAQAQTGTGKTAAFAIPIVEHVQTDENQPQALVLAPTRELAVQVAGAIYEIGHGQGVRVLAVYGGQPIDRQLRGLRSGVHVVVGTPGRLMDHIRRGTLSLETVRTVILDEGDQMLDMGFIEDIEFILDQVPKERQTGLFSATFPDRIRDLAGKYLRDPLQITVEREHMAVPNISHVAYQVPGRAKTEALTRLLDALAPPSVMVFCRTRKDVDEVSEFLQIQGYPAEGIHGDMSQAERDRVMKRFREGSSDVLIATDVAARGLDIPDVTHVINLDLPNDPEAYIHRIGRTGRAGRSGQAISLVSPRERNLLRVIERVAGTRVSMERLPTQEDVVARRWESLKDNVRTVLDEGNLEPYQVLAEEMGEDYDIVDVAAAALKQIHNAGRALTPTPLLEEMESRAEDVPAYVPESGMARLYLSLGRQDGVRPQDIVGMIANEARLPGHAIGSIEIFDRSSFVEVPRSAVSRVMKSVGRLNFRGRQITVDVARPVRESGRRPAPRYPARPARDGRPSPGRPPAGRAKKPRHG